MKKITILQNELQADIKTIRIDETACKTVIDCKIKTKDQVTVFCWYQLLSAVFITQAEFFTSKVLTLF